MRKYVPALSAKAMEARELLWACHQAPQGYGPATWPDMEDALIELTRDLQETYGLGTRVAEAIAVEFVEHMFDTEEEEGEQNG